jgi:hypothetical protein
MMLRKISLVSSLLLATLTTGCSFEHAAAVDYERMPRETAQGHQIVGYVHAETWTPAVLYVFPILPFQSAEKARRLAVEKAEQAFGADGIADVRIHTESRMPYFFILGWIENHCSATAISAGGN